MKQPTEEELYLEFNDSEFGTFEEFILDKFILINKENKSSYIRHLGCEKETLESKLDAARLDIRILQKDLKAAEAAMERVRSITVDDFYTVTGKSMPDESFTSVSWQTIDEGFQAIHRLLTERMEGK